MLQSIITGSSYINTTFFKIVNSTRKNDALYTAIIYSTEWHVGLKQKITLCLIAWQQT